MKTRERIIKFLDGPLKGKVHEMSRQDEESWKPPGDLGMALDEGKTIHWYIVDFPANTARFDYTSTTK